MKTRWSETQIKEWYNKLPWLTGSNFLPSNVINRFDMYQSYQSEEHLKVAEVELAKAYELGFNFVRLWTDFDCYYVDRNSYLSILDRYISICDKYHQKVMIVLAHEEDLPYGDKFVPQKQTGPQKKLYTHFNRNYEEYNKHFSERKHYLEYQETKELYIQMVNDIVSKYRNDNKIIAWNIINEPGITIGDRSIGIIKDLFNIVRGLDPIQPLCVDIWRNINDDGTFQSEAETIGYQLSDFISFHSYSPFPSFERRIELLKNHYNRPIVVTEWLHRINHNNIEDIYPYLHDNKIGSCIWGFVNGDTFTDEPWDILWEQYEKGNTEYDFTKWQHNILRRNLLPYDPKEIKLIKKINFKK